MKLVIVVLGLQALLVTKAAMQDIDNSILAGVDERAAPWWVQKEEAKRRKCKSSCTEYSKGVKSYVNLCDDEAVT